jgi:shikimate kinase/3-dehydroquinate synthase
MKPAVVLIGFMGAGKSSSLEALDGAAGRTVDIDDLIEQRVGMTVREFFDSRSEDEFRRVEEEVACDLLREADGGAVALGGGTVLSSAVRSELARHHVVWLDVDATTAWERVSESDRPLVARGRERFEALLAERRPIYEGLADAVLPTGDLGTVERALPSIEALAQLPPGAKLLWATSESGDYPIFVGPGLLKADWWPLEGRRFCITDSQVAEICAEWIETLDGRITVKVGEEAKEMKEVITVLGKLSEAGVTRDDHIVVLGGGVVGDVAGFCAHIYLRGIEIVQVPTTLVAQVDSAYGGKTGVNMPWGKNNVGAYHLPQAVLSDASLLESLPRDELAAGFVEALKTGLLVGGALWERVRAIESIDPTDLDDVVFACARYKCGVVAADERDSGRREVLNLGHTVGHAIEAASGYSRFRHGEAIGLGLLAALRLSGATELRDEVKAILRSHGLPVSLDPPLDVDEILAAIEHDKKRTIRGVAFVLLPELGDPRRGQYLDPEDVRAAVEELLA